MRQLKLNTARTVLVLMIDSTDHVTGKAGLALTVTSSKDGAAFAVIAPAATDLGSGWYALALLAAMVDTLGDLALHVTATGADPTDQLLQVVTDLPGVAQTGDAFARLGAAGAGLTALGDARVANLDATVSSRSTLGGTAQSGDAFARLGAAGAGLTALGDARVANLDAAVSSRASGADYTGGRAAKLDFLDVAVSSRGTGAALDAAGVRAAVGLAAANLDTQLAAIAAAQLTAAGVRAAVGLALANLDAQLAALAALIPNAAGIRAAVGLAAANLDAQLDGIADDVDALGLAVGGAAVTIVSPVSQDGEVLELFVGADYLLVDGRSIDFVRDDDTAAWPDLTGATAQLRIEGEAVIQGVPVVLTGAGQSVRFQAARAVTALFTAGQPAFQVWVTLASTAQVPIVAGRAFLVPLAD